jgi:hypothetical protein
MYEKMMEGVRWSFELLKRVVENRESESVEGKKLEEKERTSR